MGRYTLPVDLAVMPGAGAGVVFTGLGDGELVVSLAPRAETGAWTLVGIVLAVLAGLAGIKAGRWKKFVCIVTAMSLATLLAVWCPRATPFANGVFYGALILMAIYLMRWLARLVSKFILGGLMKSAPKPAAVILAILLATLASSALAGDIRPAARKDRTPAAPDNQATVIPYEGDPADADKSTKVLVPYTRFVKLWNKANPDDQIALPAPPTGFSLAAVRYEAAIEGERMNVTLTAQVKTYGKGWIALPMGISGLAVTEATLAGKRADLQTGVNGMILMLRRGVEGRLVVKAVCTPKRQGRKGSVAFTLPPFPAAVMTIRLIEPGLDLETPGVEAAPTRNQTDGNLWTLPLGMTRKISLRWSPKVGAAAADKTLSAKLAHQIYAFHWGLVGVSRATYAFSAGEYARFGLAVPAGATLMSADGANLRDYRIVGQKTIDAQRFNMIELRLHRPAKKNYAVTVRWLSDLPELGRPGASGSREPPTSHAKADSAHFTQPAA